MDYDLVCKRVLHSYRFIASGRQNIRLAITNFYGTTKTASIPIFNPKNWTTLVADML